MHFTLRRATASDADAIANVYSASFRLLTFLPIGQLSPKCGAGHFLRRLRRRLGPGEEAVSNERCAGRPMLAPAPGWSLAYS